MKDREKDLSILCSLFLGVIIGFLFAPIKKGVNVEVKNNGNVPIESN